MREKKRLESVTERQLVKEKRPEISPVRVLTSLSAILLTVTLVMGMLLFNSVSTLDGIQNRLELMDIQIEEIHSSMTGVGGLSTVPAQAPADSEGELQEGDEAIQ